MSDDQPTRGKLGADADEVVSETLAYTDPDGTTNRSGSSGMLRIRCPHCHDAVEMVDDASVVQMHCEACGSTFSLIGERTLDWEGGTDSPEAARPKIGQFELSERLGEGAFGTVWKARDTTLDRTVAVKIPRKGQLSREETEQFLREARAAAQLQHPYVVSVHEVGLEDERIYIVSDFVAGISLDDWLLDQRPTWREAAELGAKIAEALAHAHDQGVVHRDLKPSNMIIDPSGDPHLMDFGLAKREAGEVTMTVEGQILGTPAYMSPEQARGESHKADHRTDIYSLGVVLFELLTGERPFRGNVRMLLKQIVEDEPPSPRTLDARVPRDLETVCLKCLEKEPHRRYQSARDIGDELRRYLQGEAILARPIGRVARLARWCRRNPVVASLATAAVTLLVTVAVVSTLAYMRTSWALAQRSDALSRESTQRQLAQTKEAEARKAQQEAQKLATRLLVEQVDLLRRDRPLGWTWKGLESLADAMRLGGSELDRIELRSLTASCLSMVDLRPAGEFVKNEASFCLAFSPDGKQLAVAQHKAQAYASCRVTLVNLADGAERRFSYSPSFGWQLKSGVQDGGRALAFSPDGRWLVVGARSGWAYRWNLEQVNPKAVSWHAHEEEIYSLAFSPDGRTLCSASKDKSTACWEVDSDWAERGRVHSNEAMRAVFSPGGSRILTTGHSTYWRDPTTMEPIGEGLEWTGFNSVCYCGDSPLVAAASGREISLLDSRRQRVVRMLADPEFKVAHQVMIRAIDVSPDGDLLASADADGRLKLWDLVGGRLLANVLVAPIDTVRPAFSPDGRHLAVTADRRVVFFELSDRTSLFTAAIQECPVRAFAYARDGDALATVAARDEDLGVVRLWEQGKLRTEWDVDAGFEPSSKTSVSVHPSEDLLAIGSHDGNLHLVHTEKSDVDVCFRSDTTEMFAYAPHGKILWGIRDECEIVGWDAKTLDAAFVWSNRVAKTITGQARIHCLAVGHEWVVGGSNSVGTILLRAATGECETYWPKPEGPITAVALASDESLAVLGTREGSARIVHVPSGDTLADLVAHHDQIQSIAFQPGGDLLATASRDGDVCLWRIGGKQAEHLVTLHFDGGPITAVGFGPDMNQLSVLVHGEYALRVWDLSRFRDRLTEMGLNW